MLPLDEPATQIMARRYSCRLYAGAPMRSDQVARLAEFAASVERGPLGTPVRLDLAAAGPGDRDALRGLGAYGLIRHHAGFLMGAVGPGPANMEDFGYAMEAFVLLATGLGLGTCWLGGNFTRRNFGRRMGLADGEMVPAVAAVGVPPDGKPRDVLHWMARSDTRRPWPELFFRSRFGEPLAEADAGPYAVPLEMVRLAPSSNNRQPWRVVANGERHHFFLERTALFGPGTLASRLLPLADLQRVDMGIAMCHFEMAAREMGLDGRWVVDDPGIPTAGGRTEYVVTWVGKRP